jgi:hypothetical protein
MSDLALADRSIDAQYRLPAEYSNTIGVSARIVRLRNKDGGAVWTVPIDRADGRAHVMMRGLSTSPITGWFRCPMHDDFA